MSAIQATVSYDAATHTLYANVFPGNEARSGDVYVGPRSDDALRAWANDTLAAPSDASDYSTAAVVWEGEAKRRA